VGDVVMKGQKIALVGATGRTPARTCTSRCARRVSR